MLAVASMGTLGSPARASCAGLPPLARAVRDAPVVFVGTVVDLTNADRWATVEVTDVWKGDVAASVEVRGGQADPPGPMNVVSSVDRSYREDKTYLFVLDSGTGEGFLDNACTATTVYEEEMERLRPANAAPPEAASAASPPEAGGGFPWWTVGVLALVVVVGVVAAAVRRRRG